MAAYFLDTSGLLKRYEEERGTSRVRHITDAHTGHELYVARIVGPELVATLMRLRRAGQVSPDELVRDRRLFVADCANRCRVVEVTVDVAALAMDLAERRGLRGSDAIHLAAALEIQRERHASGASPLTFVSADERQLAAARVEGLLVENPERHRAS